MKLLENIFIFKNSILILITINLLSCFVLSKSPNNADTFLHWSDVKCNSSGTPQCYSQLYCKIAQKGQPTKNDSSRFDRSNCDSINQQESYTTLINGFSRISILKNKPELVIVTLHGLWYTADQFKPTLNKIIDVKGQKNFNTIEVTLPGHIKSEDSEDFNSYKNWAIENKPIATFDEWLEAMDNTLTLAKELGNKVVLVGHSTGGLLSVIAALKYSKVVDGLILVEPALQVQALRDIGSNVSKVLPGSILKALIAFSKLFNAPDVKPFANLSMGAEIQKMADSVLLKRIKSTPSIYNLNQPNFNYSDNSNELPELSPEIPPIVYTKEDLTPYFNLGKNINIPVMLLNNEHDVVISPDANKYFFMGLKGPKQYITIDFGIDFRHAYFIKEKSSQLAEYITEFIEKNISNNAF